MAGCLLFVILMYNCHEIESQALPPPKLTVYPPVITETDSVTLNCQTPSSVSVSQCYFYTLRGGTVKSFSCLKTLTGTELLKMAHQSSPAEVKVKCFYTVRLGDLNSPSPHSDPSSITIHTLLPPKLTVNPAVITETDSVTLNCQTPSSVSVSQCYFYTLSGGTVRVFSCLKTLTGSDLLNMAHQSSPAEVKVKCFYTLKVGERFYPSPHSDTSSITIQHVVEKESSMPPTMPTFSMSTGLTDSRTHVSTAVTSVKQTPVWTVGTSKNTGTSTSTSTSLTSVKPTSETDTSRTPLDPESGTLTTEKWILNIVAAVAGFGVTAGIIMLVSAILWIKRRGSEEVKQPEAQNENADTYHVYATIADEPPPSDLKGVMYSTVLSH